MTKGQKKHLQQLATIAYERDLGRCLLVIKKSIDKWQQGKLSAWDVNQKIHEYHNSIARELYKMYELSDPLMAVAFGIREGVLNQSEVNEDCRPLLQDLLANFTSDAST